MNCAQQHVCGESLAAGFTERRWLSGGSSTQCASRDRRAVCQSTQHSSGYQRPLRCSPALRSRSEELQIFQNYYKFFRTLENCKKFHYEKTYQTALGWIGMDVCKETEANAENDFNSISDRSPSSRRSKIQRSQNAVSATRLTGLLLASFGQLDFDLPVDLVGQAREDRRTFLKNEVIIFAFRVNSLISLSGLCSKINSPTVRPLPTGVQLPGRGALFAIYY